MLPFVVIWREVFMNDGDIHLARSSYEQFSPGPYRQIVEPLNLQNFYSLDTPRGYLIGSDDIALPPVSGVGIPGCRAGSDCIGWCRCRAAIS